MKINPNTTILDVAYNLSGSLAGIPAILSQLPTGERIGFDNMPEVWEDVPVDSYGQTWTPDLDGLDVELSVEVYNTPAVNKAPYSTDMKCIDVAAFAGNALYQTGEWKNELTRGNINIYTGETGNGTHTISKDFIPIFGAQYKIVVDAAGEDGTIYFYTPDKSYIGSRYLPPNSTQIISTYEAGFFKMLIYGHNKDNQNAFTIIPLDL